MVRRLNVVAAVAVAVSLVGPAVARADLVEQYEDRDYYDNSDYACALVGDDQTYLDVCGAVSDVDHDGEAESAWVGVYREVCTQEGSFRRCTVESGHSEVAPETIIIDREAGLADIDAAIDGCRIDLAFAVSGPGEGFDHASAVPSPAVRLGTMEVVVDRGWEMSWEYEPADATGSVCDWHAGEMDYAEIGHFSDATVERGFRLRPEDAPGGLIQRGERPAGSSRLEEACAYWIDDDSWVSTCGGRDDADGDGTPDEQYVDAASLECGVDTCEGDFRRTTTVETLAIDHATGDGAWAASLDGGCQVSVAVAGIRGPFRFSYHAERDDVSLGSRTGEVVVGSRDEYESRYWESEVGPGPEVCGWGLVDHADHDGASVDEVERRHSERYVGVEPGGLS